MPQPSWSPSTTQQLRKLVAAPYLAPNDWTPRSEAYFVFPLAQGTPGKQCGLAATGVYQPSLRSPCLAAEEILLIRILSIEFLLMFVIGAVVFRLTWAFTQKKLPCWSSVLILVAIILLLVPGHIDETLIVEFGGKTPPKHLLSPLAVNLLRCVGVLLGAWLATTVIGKRKKIGLEDKPPYDDFP
ncbi:hypothetical protein [Thiolapillus sp.]|uniref:hypothetical protein n=5 Tax=Thiolapillus sp. TaxID=2017437 RepID=UPI003AF82275